MRRAARAVKPWRPMKQFALALSFPLLLAACSSMQNPDAGEPVIDGSTQRPVGDVVACMTQEAAKHNASFKTTPLPEGQMLDFGDSNVVKIRADNGATTYRFYAGQRHVSNLWIEGASKICAPM
jgi:pectin methylesterase-like acyl-CoA thioesterase